MSKPTLYGPAYSTYVRTVRMTLVEKNVDYDLVDVDMISGEHRGTEHLRRHPFGRLPVFEHNGFQLYESNAIVHYIDDAFPGKRIAPAGLHRRARDQQIVDVINAYGYNRVVTRLVLPYFFADKEKGPDMAAITAAVPDIEHVLGAIQDLMIQSDPYLVGREIGFSDLFLAPIIHYLMMFPEGGRILPKLPRLAGWWLAMQQRDSLTKTVPQT
jgi:glutathione S-transferase